MAPRTQNLASDERTEREFQLDVNNAVAATEGEIASFAFGDDEPENDADTSLEQMGDGLEGGDLEDEVDDAAAGDEPLEDEQLEAGDDEIDDELDDQQPEPQPQRRQQDDRRPQRTERQDDDRQPFRRGVPPAVHREQRQRARAAEEGLETERQRGDRLERELAETRGQVSVLMQQPRSQREQPEQRADPEPDMFADPEGWKNWNRKQVQADTQQLIRRELGGFQQQMQQRDEQRIEQTFQEVKSSPEGFMLDAAYRALTSLNPRDARDRATVARIAASPNPARATLNWFEQNGAEDYRAQIAEQLGLEPADGYEDEQDDRGQGRQQRRNGGDGRRQQGNGGNRQQPSRQQQGQPRQVYRMPVSLNAARGGSGQGRGQQQDPDLMDDSDASSFEFAMRPAGARG